MKTIYDIQQYVLKFGTVIYTGNRIADLKLLESELKEIYKSGLMDLISLQSALHVIRFEVQLIKEKDTNN